MKYLPTNTHLPASSCRTFALRTRVRQRNRIQLELLNLLQRRRKRLCTFLTINPFGVIPARIWPANRLMRSISRCSNWLLELSSRTNTDADAQYQLTCRTLTFGNCPHGSLFFAPVTSCTGKMRTTGESADDELP